MRKLIVAIFTVGSIFFVVVDHCYAAWSNYGKIANIAVSNNGEWWVTMQGPMIDPQNCGNPDVYEFTTTLQNVDGRNNILATTLSAKQLNQDIRFNLTSCSPTGRPQISTVQIK